MKDFTLKRKLSLSEDTPAEFSKLKPIDTDTRKHVTPSTVTLEDLKMAGVKKKHFSFIANGIVQLANKMTKQAEAEVVDLHARVKKLFAYHIECSVDSSHMILENILLAVAAIELTGQCMVSILPSLRIASDEEISINPELEFRLRMAGKVDYAIVEFINELDFKDRLIGNFPSANDVFDIANSYLLIVEAECQDLGHDFEFYIPKAIAQAIIFLQSADLPEVRFCLSDGDTWMFFILKQEDKVLTYYESASRKLDRKVLKTSDAPLREIVQLLREWLKPTVKDLFLLESNDSSIAMSHI